MSPKTILAYLNSSRTARDVLGAAVALQSRSDAHLIGLHVVPLVTIPAIVPFEVTGEIIEVQKKVLDDEARRVAAIYKEATSTVALPYEWREIRASHYDVVRIVDAHARSADLIVAGRPDGSGGHYLPTDVTEDLMMEAGRPILVVPPGGGRGQSSEIGGRILLAWNESREAARATFDAIPFLRAAKEVRILTINPPHAKGDPELPGAEIAAALARHGVRVEAAVSIAPGLPVSEELMNRVNDLGCDMVVMGGYGHSRLGELVFGGATREMLRRCPVPMLISH
jgi:nucleotide-binding universal stress UspA family protein